ncbi:hypothetical protein [Geoalkalibacter halelectricus]|uniref:Phytase-like domain-containing protein n=1 Tax=Geoalkalibacter halelectricus TaxID=2847045 RepID=A0ABY5ZPW1_9BACT|nr:hypothetical protein [Geoalkalibacter halelectricus]MDO3376899.1 hypothetical protein [Geoalkalibacter halelectricus]UWZ81123.1 hypothetical protein L9S41_06935 [Geoalkalibacter halelectricus]
MTRGTFRRPEIQIQVEINIAAKRLTDKSFAEPLPALNRQPRLLPAATFTLLIGLLSLAAWFLLDGPCRTAHAQEQPLAAYAIENPTAEGPLMPWGLGPLAVWGSRSALPYHDGRGQDWLYIQDRTGWELHLRIPGELSPNDRSHAGYAFATPNDFWLWSGVLGRAALRHYRLNTQGARIESLTLVRETAQGDQNTRPAGLISLANGALVGAWHQFTYHEDRHLEIGFLYRSPDGRVSTLGPLRVPGRAGTPVATRWALAQHPGDGSIWAFLKRDSYREISAIRLVEDGGRLRVERIVADFIDRRAGLHTPESEFPYLAAVADLQRKVILLAYQNSRQQIFHVADSEGNLVAGVCPEPAGGRLAPHAFAKSAQISIAEIHADGRTSFVDLPAYTERVRPFGLAVEDDIWLMFEAATCRAQGPGAVFTNDEILLTRRRESWLAPQRIGRAETVNNTLAAHIFFNPEWPQFVVRLANGRLHTIERR